MLTKLHTNPSKNFFGSTQKKLEGFVWSFLSFSKIESAINWINHYPGFGGGGLGLTASNVNCFDKF